MTVYFDSKSLVGKDNWIAKTDGGWCQFLNDHGIWSASAHNGSTVSGGYDFTVPTTGYYAVNSAADDYGNISIDNTPILNIRNSSQTWTTYVWLAAGKHHISISATDTGKGNYGVGVTVEDSQVVFNLKTEALKTGKWNARTDSGWCQFLSSNGVWTNQYSNQIDTSWTLTVPANGYYTVNASCDNWGTVWIDNLPVLDIRDYGNVWSSSAYLTAGTHTIRVLGHDNGGNYGVGVTVEKSTTYFNLKNFSLRNWGWAPRTDDSWCQFLNANATWPAKYQKEVNVGTEFQVPAKAYYTVTGSCDDYGYIEIDGKRVVDIKDYKNTWSASVLLEAGNHWVQTFGHDNSGNYGLGVSISANIQSVVDAQTISSQATADEQVAKADYDTKQAQAVSAQAAVQPQITTDITITIGNDNANASASASAKAYAEASGQASAGVDGNYASAGASAEVGAGVNATAEGSANAGNQYAGVGASGSASGYADATITAEANVGAGLQGNNATVGGGVNIVVKTEAGVSAEAQAQATLLGIQIAEAEAQGSADTYTEVYVHADGSVTVGENGATVQAGAVAGYSVGAEAKGSAGVNTVLGDASVKGGAGASVGAQVGAEGEAHATYENGKISIGITGEAAILVGLKGDVNLNLDLNPTIEAINAAINSGKTINEAISIATCGFNQTAVAYNQTQKQLQIFADQCLAAAKQAEGVYNDAVNVANKAAQDVVNATNQAITTAENGFKSAGQTITNGIVNLGNSIASGASSIANDIGHYMNPRNWF